MWYRERERSGSHQDVGSKSHREIFVASRVQESSPPHGAVRSSAGAAPAIDAHRGLRGLLDEQRAHACCERLALRRGHRREYSCGGGKRVVRQGKEGGGAHLVDLVADDNLDDGAGDVRFELGEPPGQRLEGLAIRDVVDEDDALRSTVIRGRAGPEASCPAVSCMGARSPGISYATGGGTYPYAQLDPLALHLHLVYLPHAPALASLFRSPNTARLAHPKVHTNRRIRLILWQPLLVREA